MFTRSFCVTFLVFLCSLVFGQETISIREKEKVIKKVQKKLIKEYVDPTLGEQAGNFLLHQFHLDQYHDISGYKAFSDKVTKDMRSISRDKHLALVYKPYGEKMKDSVFYPIKHNPFPEVSMFDGNIGYLKINSFFFHKRQLWGPLKELSKARVLIIDLRDNIGGLASNTNYALSYFLKGGRHYANWYSKENNIIAKVKTRDKVKGKKLPEIPLYILVSEETFSAGEAFAYHMQAMGRAIIIGDTTSGAAHAKKHVNINKNFFLSLPEWRSVSTITGKDWEGAGVIPDIIAKEEDALAIAFKLVFKE